MIEPQSTPTTDNRSPKVQLHEPYWLKERSKRVYTMSSRMMSMNECCEVRSHFRMIKAYKARRNVLELDQRPVAVDL